MCSLNMQAHRFTQTIWKLYYRAMLLRKYAKADEIWNSVRRAFTLCEMSCCLVFIRRCYCLFGLRLKLMHIVTSSELEDLNSHNKFWRFDSFFPMVISTLVNFFVSCQFRRLIEAWISDEYQRWLPFCSKHQLIQVVNWISTINIRSILTFSQFSMLSQTLFSLPDILHVDFQTKKRTDFTFNVLKMKTFSWQFEKLKQLSKSWEFRLFFSLKCQSIVIEVTVFSLLFRMTTEKNPLTKIQRENCRGNGQQKDHNHFTFKWTFIIVQQFRNHSRWSWPNRWEKKTLNFHSAIQMIALFIVLTKKSARAFFPFSCVAVLGEFVLTMPWNMVNIQLKM